MISTIVTAAVSAILGWLARHLQLWFKQEKARKADEAKNQTAREKLEKAQTPEEREDAAKTIADNF